MSDGTSQGLYVIIAVVIFGIFVGISYLIFQEQLKPKLMSIFETSTNKALEDLTGFTLYRKKDLKPLESRLLTTSGDKYSFKGLKTDLERDGYDSSTYNTKVSELLSNFPTEDTKIPWGHALEVYFDVSTKYDLNLSYDYNTYIKDENDEFYGNDMYLDYKKNLHDNHQNILLKEKETKTVKAEYANYNLSKNPDKKDLYQFNKLKYFKNKNDGLEGDLVDFTVSNVRYKIVPYPAK